jgi:replicative DNA helicase
VVDPERDANAILDDSEEKLFQLGEQRKNLSGCPSLVADTVESVIADVETSYKAGRAHTLDTGLVDLDKLIGGLAPGDLCVLAARPGMGKSALAGTIAHNIAREPRRKRVLFFSLEMTKAQLIARWLAGDTGISTERQRAGSLTLPDWQRFIEAGTNLKELTIFVDDQPRLSVAQMRQRARRMRRRHGLDLIIVDHLQLIRIGGRIESRRIEIGEASGTLKALAKELGVPVLLLSQLNRNVENREDKRPMLADLRESGDIEQDADVVMFLFREEYYLERNEPRRRMGESSNDFIERQAAWIDRCQAVSGHAEIIVAKNRQGRTGKVDTRFDANRQVFESLFRG